MIYVLNGAYLLMLVALTIRRMLVLRIILISAQSLFILFGAITANYVMLVWNTLFLSINVFQVIVIFRQRAPVVIADAIADIYEGTFGEFSRREFVYFWQVGTERMFEEEAIVEDGHAQPEVMLILDGTARVVKHNRQIAELARGDFVAEMSFLTGDPASADVVCDGQVTTITWSHENLKNLKNLNFQLWSKIQHVLSRDLVGKVRRTSSRLHDDNPVE